MPPPPPAAGDVVALGVAAGVPVVELEGVGVVVAMALELGDTLGVGSPEGLMDGVAAGLGVGAPSE